MEARQLSDFEANLAATGDVSTAYERLTKLGLVSKDTTVRGVDKGMQTLADLLAVLTFQIGTGSSHAEQGASATSRAMCWGWGRPSFAEIANQPTTDAETLQLLTAAARTARGG